MLDSIESFSFFKFVLLIITPGSFAVRQKLKKKVRDQKLSLKDFLNQKKHEIYHLYQRDFCCLCQQQAKSRQHGRELHRKEWELLFEKKCKTRHKTCCCNYEAIFYRQEEDLDITLVICLLINLFPLSDEEKKNLEDLREHRNFYAHALNAHIEDTDYVKRLTEAISVIKAIAQSCEDPQIHKWVCREIRNIMDSSVYNVYHKEIVSWNRDEKVTRETFEKAMILVENLLKQEKEVQITQYLYRISCIIPCVKSNKSLYILQLETTHMLEI